MCDVRPLFHLQFKNSFNLINFSYSVTVCLRVHLYFAFLSVFDWEFNNGVGDVSGYHGDLYKPLAAAVMFLFIFVSF